MSEQEKAQMPQVLPFCILFSFILKSLCDQCTIREGCLRFLLTVSTKAVSRAKQGSSMRCRCSIAVSQTQLVRIPRLDIPTSAFKRYYRPRPRSSSLSRARSLWLTLSFSLCLSGSGSPPFVYVEGWLGIGSLEVLRQPGLSVRRAHD